MKCGICSLPVKLSPNAAERAKKFGGRPEDYTELFPNHSSCIVKERNRKTLELIRRNQNDFDGR